MAKLRLGALDNDKAVKVTLELPAKIHRDLVYYAETVTQPRERSAEHAILMANRACRAALGNWGVDHLAPVKTRQQGSTLMQRRPKLATC
jgi:hypothetical protein